MRTFTELLTIAAGGTGISNPVDIGAAELAGIYIQQAGGGAPGDLKFQALVGGQAGQASGPDQEVWADVMVTQTTDPPTPSDTGYNADRLKLDNPGGFASNLIVMFRTDVAGRVPPILRLVHTAAPTGTPTLCRLIINQGPNN